MIPFPGESIGCPDAYASDGYGYQLWKDVWLREQAPGQTTPGHRVLASGNEFRCWAYHYDHPPYLETTDTTPIEVSWVVEVLSGTGTLVVSDFHDDDWDESSTDAYPNALGTLTVTGAGTYVIPTTSFTNDVLIELGWDRGPAAVRLQCTAGSIDIQQVKLRVWPVGGPLGTWSADEVTEASQNIWPTVSNQPTAVIDPGTWANQGDLRDSINIAEVSSFASPVFSGTNMAGASFTALHTEYDPEVAGNISQYGAGTSFLYIKVEPGHMVGPGAEGTVWIRPPEEVQGERDTYLFDGGPGSVSWLQGIVSWLVSASASDGTNYWYASGSFHVNIQAISGFLASGTLISTYVGSGSPIDSFPSPGAAGPSYVLDSFPMPNTMEPGQLYLLTFTHDGFFGDVDEEWDGTFAGGSSSLQVYRGDWSTYPDDSPLLLRATWTPDAYHYWDPFAEAIEPEPEFVPAGYFLKSLQDLSGLGDGVDVNFA